MTVITKPIGRLPLNKGDWDANYVNPKTGLNGYGNKFRVIRYGCELESKMENNTYDPIVWDGAQSFVIDNAHWLLISGSPEAWLDGQDKPATTGTIGNYPYNGMGRVVLKKNMVNIAEQGEPEDIVNLLTQDAFEDGEGNPLTNTVFVIQYDFTLGEDITIPENCILEFDGGSISNTSGNSFYLDGNKSSFNYTVGYHIFKNVVIKNFNIPYLDIRWFGAKVAVDSVTGEDCSYAFDTALECLKFHAYIYINIIGSYVIKRSVVTDLDLCLRGSSFVTKEMSGTTPPSIVTSKLIIADGVTGFVLTGRGETYKYAMIDIDSVSFWGEGTKSATALKITASGAPGRPNNINKCTFVNLECAIKIEEEEGHNSTLGNLNISTCFIEVCHKAIYASTNSVFGVTNLQIINCNIEHNDYGCIDIHSFGNLVISNNILEGEDTPLIIKIHSGSATINDNYFEATTSENHPYSVLVEGSSNTRPLKFVNNSHISSVCFKTLCISDYIVLGNNSLYNDCVFIRCTINKLQIKNFGKLCYFYDTKIPSASKSKETSFEYHLYDTLYKDKVLSRVFTSTNAMNVTSVDEGEVFITLSGSFWKRTNNSNEMGTIAFLDDNYDVYDSSITYISGEFIAIGKLQKGNNDTKFAFVNSIEGVKYFINWLNMYSSYNSDDIIADYIEENKEKGCIMNTNPELLSNNSCAGFWYFNTVSKKPIYWNGTAWVDATGTPV